MLAFIQDWMMEKLASDDQGSTRAGNCIVKRLEDLAKEGDSPVDSFQGSILPSKTRRVRMMIAFTRERGTTL